jgi:predicted nucleic acid-binding protein
MERRGVLSTQVLQEFFVNVQRQARQPISRYELKEVIRDYLAWEVVVNSAEAVLSTMEFEDMYKISFWAAMIVQAAENANCQVLYSEDFSNGQEYEGMLVINPFEQSQS